MLHDLATTFLPGDIGVLLPVAGVLDSILLDFTVRDLTFWFKLMSWSEFAGAASAFLAIKIVCDRIEARVIGLIKPRALRLLAARFPRLSQRFS